MAVYKTYKKIGETPLEALNRVVSENSIPKEVSVTFAGRLDPAAEGEMVFLSGETIKEKENYLNKDKIYEVDYVLGISTDTGDLLGLIKQMSLDAEIAFDLDDIKIALIKLSGTRNQNFHKFSSKVIDGKPMWLHAKEGKEIVANHEVTIKSLEVLEVYNLKVSDISERAIEITNLVNGEFRQKEIVASWAEAMDDSRQFPILRIRAHVSSGTYMRTLGEELGELIGLPVCAYNIKRLQVLI